MTTATAAHATTDAVRILHAEDRCDRCPAAARVLVLLHDGGDLAFCHHHANQHRRALTPIAMLIEHRAR